jgi:hypothetical protein
MNNRLVRFFLILFIASLGVLACADSITSLKQIAGIWNSKKSVEAAQKGKLDEATQPYKLEYNSSYYWGWVGSLEIQVNENTQYLAVFGGSFAVEKVKYLKDSMILHVVYKQNTHDDIISSQLTVHFTSKDSIWFEPESGDRGFMSYLSVNGISFGPLNEYIRAPKWNGKDQKNPWAKAPRGSAPAP